MNSKLREALYVYMNKHGNTLCQWKNNDYEFAQSLPESQQEEIVPELLKAIRQAVGEEMLELVEHPHQILIQIDDIEYLNGGYVSRVELREKIKEWSQS